MGTIASIWEYPKLTAFSLPDKYSQKLDNGDEVVGVEIELENVKIKDLHDGWTTHEDHSLKNEGVEFVSHPTKMKFLSASLSGLFKNISGEATPRCGVHIHINVRDLSVEELDTFLMIYTIFERSLFNFAGGRAKSNFCVPITDDNRFIKQWFTRVYDWRKYIALNISPIWGGESKRLGTVEFRHLVGTTDVELIMKWANIICSIKKYSKQVKSDTVKSLLYSLNTTSGYWGLCKEVFGDYSQELSSQDTFKRDVEFGVSFLKLCYAEIKEEKEAVQQVEGVLEELAPVAGDNFYKQYIKFIQN